MATTGVILTMADSVDEVLGKVKDYAEVHAEKETIFGASYSGLLFDENGVANGNLQDGKYYASVFRSKVANNLGSVLWLIRAKKRMDGALFCERSPSHRTRRRALINKQSRGKQQPEVSLIDRARNGDAEAFAELTSGLLLIRLFPVVSAHPNMLG